MSVTSPSLLRDMLFLMKIRPVAMLSQYTDDDIRNTGIAEACYRTSDTISQLQGRPDREIAGILMVNWMLIRLGFIAPLMAPSRPTNPVPLSSSMQRELIIDMMVDQPLQKPTLDTMATVDLMQAFYKYYYFAYNSDVLTLRVSLASPIDGGIIPPMVQIQYGGGYIGPKYASVDVLSLVDLRADPLLGFYLGVFHHGSPSDADYPRSSDFGIYLTTSTDLVQFTPASLLFSGASMPKLYGNGKGGLRLPFPGFLLVYQENGRSGVSKIACAWWRTLNDLLTMQLPTAKFVAPTTLSAVGLEGTPNLIRTRLLQGPGANADHPGGYELTIGFHYNTKTDISRDVQAVGSLTAFRHWTAIGLKAPTEFLSAQSFMGNIGGRTSFTYFNVLWFVVEVQQVPNAGNTWKVFLTDGIGFIAMQVYGNMISQSQGNPFILLDENTQQGAATYFLRAESGALASRLHGELVFKIRVQRVMP